VFPVRRKRTASTLLRPAPPHTPHNEPGGRSVHRRGPRGPAAARARHRPAGSGTRWRPAQLPGPGPTVQTTEGRTPVPGGRRHSPGRRSAGWHGSGECGPGWPGPGQPGPESREPEAHSAAQSTRPTKHRARTGPAALLQSPTETGTPRGTCGPFDAIPSGLRRTPR
jgi:hypothetical protein